MPDTRAVAEAFLAKLEAGDVAGAFEAFAADGVYTIIGDTPISGRHAGRDAFFAKLGPVMAEAFTGPPTFKFDELIVEEDRAVAIGSGQTPARFGPYIQNHYAFFLRIDAGEIQEIREFMDPSQIKIAMFGQKWADTHP